ncbi:MAG: type IV secretory system conjugative DNA transfer family protein [Oligoflexales bacterium]
MSTLKGQRDNIPVPAALLLLGAVLWVLICDPSAESMTNLGDQIESFMDRNGTIVMVTAILAFFNAFSVSTYVSKFWSYRKQGSRLRDLVGERQQGIEALWSITYGVISATILYSCLLWAATHFLGIPGLADALPDVVTFSVIVNISLAGAIMTHWGIGILREMRKSSANSLGLASLPREKDRIAIGTAMSGGEPSVEEWVVLNNKALCGNILVTGSIGSGKTQGTILPYFDQVLANQNPTPAVLAIDPKGTFIKEALEIAARHGKKDDVLHLRLDGSVTFNPIYLDNVLEMGRFLDVAQMVRAAAINFSGRSSADSPFWELSAFNLTKNAVIYCAAVYGYYTLNDLYCAMVDAVEGRSNAKLESVIEGGKLKGEPLHNVRQAIIYFSQEFQSFDHKLKTGILATATSFLSQFQEFRASKIFCPKQDERTILSMDQIVDNGKMLFFDVNSPGLARAMGTFIKLHFQQSVLERLTNEKRLRDRAALLIMDEYQDVVSTGRGTTAGDDRFLAKGREANAITIAATQSLSSIENSVGKSDAAKELFQNFRTRIACHSTDLLTIRTFQDLIGEEDRQKRSHSYSELSQDTRKNYVLGGFDADNANISESISTSVHRESIVTGKDFSRLNAFEALSLVYDGVKTKFVRLNLKPYFLGERNVSHCDLQRILNGAVASCALAIAVSASGFPNVCDVVQQPAFSSCMEYQVSSCTCPGIPPRPCARFSYYVPDTFIEVTGEAGSTKFHGLPGVEAQLSSLTGVKLPYGTEGDDFEAFQARTLVVPLASTVFEALPCSSGIQDTTCFGAMSEHLGSKWSTGAADLSQPNSLAWAASPKACLIYGAARSLSGGGEAAFGGGSASCSVSKDWVTQYPPSAHSACNGWGIFYPRVGMYDGPSQTTAALMIADRMKSLSTEVFHSASSTPDEKWQMILPSSSQCFREGQNVGLLETGFLVNDRGRLRGRFKDYLFVTWRRVSCCKDYTDVPVASAALTGLQAACKGLGGVH